MGRHTAISNFAGELATAMCEGSASSAPHVHVAVDYAVYSNDERVEINETNLDFTAFSHRAGVGENDVDCTRSRYIHYSVGKVCPLYDQMLNDAALPDYGEIFSDGFESGDTLEWL